jgi:AraC family transcriptional regulator
MAEKNNSLQEEYISRINRVIDYVDAHIDEELSLERLAGVAHFSPYHFHRIFSALIGEPLNKYVQRIRIERAANILLTCPNRSVTDIAFGCGFASSQFFARIFREYFNEPPSVWRERNKLESKIIHIKSRKIKENPSSIGYYTGEKEKRFVKAIAVKQLPTMNVAYIRSVGPYKGDIELFRELFSQLFAWAAPRGYLDVPDLKVISMYNDNPNITDEERLRLTLCITIPETAKVDRHIGMLTIEGGLYVVARCELMVDEYEEAWNYLCGEWFPRSGYFPDNKPSFEINCNDPATHPEGKHIVDICVPVKPL